MTLAEYLYESRMTQAHLAGLAGVHYRTIANVLAGRDIRLSVALQIEDATDGFVKCRDLMPKSYVCMKKKKS